VNDDLDQADGKLSAQEAYCARQRLAEDNAALFPTRLAIARWRSGIFQLQSTPPSSRAAWYTRLGREHQAWLERGGFTQYEELTPLRAPSMWHPSQDVPAQPSEVQPEEQSISQDQNRGQV